MVHCLMVSREGNGTPWTFLELCSISSAGINCQDARRDHSEHLPEQFLFPHGSPISLPNPLFETGFNIAYAGLKLRVGEDDFEL